MTSAWEIIRKAIDGRRCLMLTYHNYSRVVEPYALGMDGVEVLLAYQVGGGDEEQAPIGWKTFDVAAITGASILNEHFSGQRRMPAREPDRRFDVTCAVAAGSPDA